VEPEIEEPEPEKIILDINNISKNLSKIQKTPGKRNLFISYQI
jgi:hypothetical protein